MCHLPAPICDTRMGVSIIYLIFLLTIGCIEETTSQEFTKIAMTTETFESCHQTEHGCCPDGVTAATADLDGCPEGKCVSDRNTSKPKPSSY